MDARVGGTLSASIRDAAMQVRTTDNIFPQRLNITFRQLARLYVNAQLRMAPLTKPLENRWRVTVAAAKRPTALGSIANT